MPDKSLLDQLNVHLSTDRDAVWRRYRELLTDNVGDDQQVAELKALMPALGKTLNDVVADQKTVARVKQLNAVIRAGRDLEPVAARAQQAVDAKADEVKREHQRLAAELAAARGEATAVHERQLAAREACGEIAGLKLDNPELLAEVPNVDPAKL